MPKSGGVLSIGRIAHAGLVIKTAEVQCIMDPALLPVMSRMYVMEPPIQVDRRKLRANRFDALILSHHHDDHFCLDSLNLLDRDILVIYPKDFPLIESYLTRMGFHNFKPISPWEKFQIGDLTLIPTPSQASFPEMGMIFRSGNLSCWNAVDTELNNATIRKVRKLTNGVDLMLCYFQLLIELEVYRNALGSNFNYERHQKQLLDVVKTDPKFFLPGSCGWRDKFEPWRNNRQFQMTEPQFIEDVRKIRPRLRGLRIGPGDRIDIHRGCSIKRSGLDFVRPAGSRRYAFYDWRPDLGVPPLADPNPSEYSVAWMKKTIRSYLEGKFLSVFNSSDPSDLVKSWKKQKLLWRLELVYPGDYRETRLLDFGGKKVRWIKLKEEIFPGIHTSIAASVIPDILASQITTVQAIRLTRRTTRQYAIDKKGLHRLESSPSPLDGDPIAEALFYGAYEKAYLNRLIRMGY